MSFRFRTGALDIGQPVNRGCGLNYGLVSWWLTYHNPFSGGARFLDLCGTNHGTLTNGPTWGGALGRPGGSGSLLFDGTDDFVGVTPSGLPGIGSAKSISFWMTYDGTTTRRYLVSLVKDDTSSANNAVDIEINTEFGIPKLMVAEWGGAKLADAFPTDYGLTGDIWFHVIYTYSGSGTGHKIYLNGLDRTFSTGSTAQTGTTGIVRLASFNAAFPDPYHNRRLDDIRIYDRELSAGEAAALYHASRQGYQNELNWIRRPVVFDVGGGAPGGLSIPIASYHYRHHLAA